MAIRFRMPARRITIGEAVSAPILTLKLVVMATSVDRSEKEGQILNLHTVKFVENRSSR